MAYQKSTSSSNGMKMRKVGSIFATAFAALIALSTQRLQLLSPMSLQGKFISKLKQSSTNSCRWNHQSLLCELWLYTLWSLNCKAFKGSNNSIDWPSLLQC